MLNVGFLFELLFFFETDKKNAKVILMFIILFLIVRVTLGDALKTKILFIEDELSLQKSITYILEKEGFAVIAANSGEEGVEFAIKESPDLILLDLMLPGIDGFKVCEILKNNKITSNCFIIMLTGKKSLEDITKGLSQYADDYMTKPFEPAILIARINAVLRRKIKTKTNIENLIKLNNLVIDKEARVVIVDGNNISLTKTEFNLLLLLATNPNIVFNRSKILDHIRQYDYESTERVVDYQISCLRKKLSKYGQFIETVHGIGYKFKI